ncbi:MAG: squalene--hopene cyclase [Bryobacterales bacterium]|nr:squalene--hopene cyclase [Bryobacterales bacterium]
MRSSAPVADTLANACQRSIERAAHALLDAQKPEGYWWGDLTADTTLESDYVLLQLWMHPPNNGVWNPPTRELINKCTRAIMERQNEDGGFWIYPGGPSDISASVKAYFALKLAGIPVADERMTRLRDCILSLGGMQKANSYVKINCSLFNVYPREYAPTVPPELMLFGNVIYEMSSWTRAIVIPLSIVQSSGPRPVPTGFNLDELFVPGVPLAFPNNEGFFSWRNFFLTADKVFKRWQRFGLSSVRQKALKKAEQWMLDHTKHSEGLGAIYPSMMYVVMALDCLGYPKDHPEAIEAEKQFNNLLVDDGERFFFQPCFSPVWDSAIVAFALGEAGIAPEPAMAQCADWMLSKEVRRKGDWSVKRPNVEPGGWYFEFANEFYPDIDDTAMVLLGLQHAQSRNTVAQQAAVRRAIDWLLAMQGADGGFAAFDVDNCWNFLNSVPFADHNAMLDPSCPDITGRVLEALSVYGMKGNHPAIRKAVNYLLRTQEADGSWYGRWGVDYIYGTFLALRGLRAAGESDREAHILRAGEWLRSIQNADGGWGESCESYAQHSYVNGLSTASQTAWAILGLIASGDTDSISLQKGVEYLIDTQRANGRWDEAWATGTGFPRVFYLAYHLYRDSFPLLALATYMKSRGQGRGDLA